MENINKLRELLKVYKIKDSVILRVGNLLGYGGYAVPKKLIEDTDNIYSYNYNKDINTQFEDEFLSLYRKKQVKYNNQDNLIDFGESKSCKNLLKINLNHFEYEFLKSNPIENLSHNITGIIIEFYSIQKNLSNFIKILTSLNNSFCCVAYHGNNLYGVDYIDEYLIPNNIEIVLVNKNIFCVEEDNNKTFLGFNLPCCTEIPDYLLNFDVAKTENNLAILSVLNNILLNMPKKMQICKNSHNEVLKKLEILETLNTRLKNQTDLDEENYKIINSYKIVFYIISIIKFIIWSIKFMQRVLLGIKNNLLLKDGSKTVRILSSNRYLKWMLAFKKI